MKSDFLLAITQISAEKNLPKEVVLSAVEAALVSAYRKNEFVPNQNISVKINPSTGRVQVWAEKTVVERPSDTRQEMSLAEAKRIKPDAKLGDALVVEATPANAGRIAAQTAKQVILQRLHEAEYSAIFEEYAGREADIVTGTVQRIEPRQLFIDLGRAEAVLPAAEQVPNEKYRMGQRVKAYLLEVSRTNKGPRVILSRSHPDFLRRLFELEVPEIANGVVEVKSIAREAGSRSKVAVGARQEGVDPVGCCVGLRGIRIQNIVNELSGEKIDVVLWSRDPAIFIANALSPAQILSVKLDEKDGVATVVVPDKQLSLAIGKEGQNVRLAAKLTGWRIDIKSASAVEAEKAAIEAQRQAAEAERAAVEAAKKAAEAEAVAKLPVEVEEKEEKVEAAPEEVPVEEPVLEPALAATTEKAEVLPSLESAFVPPPALAARLAGKGAKLRFAEDILAPSRSQAKTKKKKKKVFHGREIEEDAGKGKRRGVELPGDEEEGY
ncbi:MAG: transcription termination/antitermination protein NusA [Chloroflexi bacterium]|nr:transcription termination/antitermination protein NusA [Chloroflexota bacterium]